MTRAQAEALRADIKNWKFGFVYHCQDDPRFIVRNRWKFGWTWNFGNRKTALLLPIFMLIFLTPALFIAPIYGLNFNETIALTGIVLAILIFIANYVANGPR